MLTWLRECWAQKWCLVWGHDPVFEYSRLQQKTIQRCTRCLAWAEVPW